METRQQGKLKSRFFKDDAFHGYDELSIFSYLTRSYQIIFNLKNMLKLNLVELFERIVGKSFAWDYMSTVAIEYYTKSIKTPYEQPCTLRAMKEICFWQDNVEPLLSKKCRYDLQAGTQRTELDIHNFF